ncbi:hypothetical protein [Amycolatopsis australiensis]|uniref:hypothetical protein n=1 Tax=Amycolatopsis australiensis TaxID=546364 RepID=UPI0015A51F82|nr:hypothetical protein [Amycolatopsis australiensis]
MSVVENPASRHSDHATLGDSDYVTALAELHQRVLQLQSDIDDHLQRLHSPPHPAAS